MGQHGRGFSHGLIGAIINSRQRVLSAINPQEPDGLSVDLGATPSSGISAIAYDNLLQHLELKDQRNWVYDVVQQVA